MADVPTRSLHFYFGDWDVRSFQRMFKDPILEAPSSRELHGENFFIFSPNLKLISNLGRLEKKFQN